MIPPVYAICAGSSVVTDLLGAEPRIYEFGQAPENAQSPYVIWQTISGAPENNLDSTPGYDHYRVQIDCYAGSKSVVLSIAKAIRSAVEIVTDIESWNGEGTDPQTNEFTYSFDVVFNIPRE